MDISKKKIEAWRFDQFRSFIPDFPEWIVEPAEEPDFLVHGPNRVVGIELTDLYRETKAGEIPEQATEAMCGRVLNRAQAIYTAQKMPPVLAMFFLDNQVHIKKPEVEILAKELAELVILNLPAPNGTTEVPIGWEDTRVLPNILHSLQVHRLDAVTRTFFSSPCTTWVQPLTREDIKRVLCSKEPKYSNYKAKCDEAWLVINVDFESRATWFDFDCELLREPFITSFERSFLVRHFSGRAHELNLKASES